MTLTKPMRSVASVAAWVQGGGFAAFDACGVSERMTNGSESMIRHGLELVSKGCLIGAVRGLKFSLVPVMLGIMLLQVITIVPGAEWKLYATVLAVVPVIAGVGAGIGGIVGLIAAVLGGSGVAAEAESSASQPRS